METSDRLPMEDGWRGERAFCFLERNFRPDPCLETLISEQKSGIKERKPQEGKKKRKTFLPPEAGLCN